MLMRIENPGIGAELPMNCRATMPAVAPFAAIIFICLVWFPPPSDYSSVVLGSRWPADFLYVSGWAPVSSAMVMNVERIEYAE